MKKKIALLAGDGIGPEIMGEAKKVLEKVASVFNHSFVFKEGVIGGAAYEKHQNHFPKETIKICETSDAILFGAVGGPPEDRHLVKWKDCEINSILAIRKKFQFHTNFRPIQVFDGLQTISPLRKHIIEGVDLLIVRELASGIYFGEHQTKIENNKRIAHDIAQYTEDEIKCVVHRAFQEARKRRKKLTSADKANVLDTSKLWRQVVTEVGKEYDDIHLEHLYIDYCAMKLIQDPHSFDVIVTNNLFGDILSDLAAVIPGSMGLGPSASFNHQGFGFYEPIAGSAPDLAGKNEANPIAEILSAALLLRHSFQLEVEAKSIENAIQQALVDGFRTSDLLEEGFKAVGTREMGREIVSRIAGI